MGILPRSESHVDEGVGPEQAEEGGVGAVDAALQEKAGGREDPQAVQRPEEEVGVAAPRGGGQGLDAGHPIAVFVQDVVEQGVVEGGEEKAAAQQQEEQAVLDGGGGVEDGEHEHATRPTGRTRPGS